MRFEETYSLWTEGRLTQEEAARILGVHERSFRRHINRYRENGLDGLIDKRLNQVSARKAPVDEVIGNRGHFRKCPSLCKLLMLLMLLLLVCSSVTM